MLDIFKSHCIFAGNTYKIFLILILCNGSLSLSALQHQGGLKALPRVCEHEWADRYFHALDENTSIEEAIDFLVCLKVSLQAKGYAMPSLTELCLHLRNELIDKGIDIDNASIERIYDEIIKRENTLIQSSSFSLTVNTYPNYNAIQIKKHSKKKELEVSDGFAIGFIKALGGALLCIIPHPAATAIGAGLVINGISDMIQHAGDPPNSGSIEERLRSLPPPPDQHPIE